ncbi:hypothetical protein CSB95_4883 [Pseudomonas aeruginosa]|nr:hypothetical protein CSC29_0901 [Pseudomonas aeruginosa]PRW10760.1 hypothetical protein CSB95_4883 [Pseudomonas aeruginosa]
MKITGARRETLQKPAILADGILKASKIKVRKVTLSIGN